MKHDYINLNGRQYFAHTLPGRCFLCGAEVGFFVAAGFFVFDEHIWLSFLLFVGAAIMGLCAWFIIKTDRYDWSPEVNQPPRRNPTEPPVAAGTP